jgi:predicted nucleic acid-binding Zn ribbon protein
MRLDDLHDDADWCQQCGARLPCDAYWGRRRFCSRECQRRAEGRLVGDERMEALAKRHCEMCGGPVPMDRHMGLYCSKHCRKRYFHRLRSEARAEARAGRECVVCGRSLDHLSRSDTRYCSRTCQGRAYRARRDALVAPRLPKFLVEPHLGVVIGAHARAERPVVPVSFRLCPRLE